MFSVNCSKIFTKCDYKSIKLNLCSILLCQVESNAKNAVKIKNYRPKIINLNYRFYCTTY